MSWRCWEELPTILGPGPVLAITTIGPGPVPAISTTTSYQLPATSRTQRAAEGICLCMHMRCRACTASCYQMAVTAIVAGERYSLVCFCWACSVHVLAPICQTAFVAPRPHERELSGHERSTCAAVHALPAATLNSCLQKFFDKRFF